MLVHFHKQNRILLLLIVVVWIGRCDVYIKNPLPNHELQPEEDFLYIMPTDTFGSTNENTTISYSVFSRNDWIKRGIGNEVLRNGYYFFRPDSIEVFGDYLFVCDYFFGLRIFDISNQTVFTKVSELYLEGGTFYDLSIDPNGEYLYITSWRISLLYIIDIREVYHPRVVTDYDSVALYLYGVYSTEDYLFVCEYGYGLRAIDVSDKENPITVSVTPTASLSPYRVVVIDEIAWIADGESGIRAINVSDVDHPYEIGNYDDHPCTVLIVEGNYVYCKSGNDFRIVEISDTYSMELVGEILTIYTQGMSYDPRFGIVYGATGAGYYSINVTDPSNPEIVSSILWNDVCVDVVFIDDPARIILSCGGEGGIRGINTTDPLEPEVTEAIILENYDIMNLKIDYETQYAYFCDKSSLFVMDVSDKMSPKLVAQYYEYGMKSRDLWLSGRYLFLATKDLYVMDIFDPTNPILFQVYENEASQNNLIVMEGNILFLSNMYNYRIEILDVTNPANPLFKSYYNTWGQIYCILVVDDILLLCVDTNLEVVDVSNLTLPKKLGDFVSDRRINGVYYEDSGKEDWSQFAYIASREHVRIINITNTSNPVEYGNYHDGSANFVSITGFDERIYAIDRNGLTILDVSEITDNPTPQWDTHVEFNSEGKDITIPRTGGYIYVVTQASFLILGDQQVVLFMDFLEDTFFCGSVEVVVEAFDTLNSSAKRANSTFGVQRIYNTSNPFSLCRAMGDCVDNVNCDCFQGWDGPNCNDAICFNISSSTNPGEVCSRNGACIEPDTCECTPSNLWYGPECSYHFCFGVGSMNTSYACLGHGQCISRDHCLCNPGFASSVPFGECDLYFCNEILFSDVENVCSGHGKCVDHNTCICFEENFEGEDCETWSCNGLDHNDHQRTCSGKGECIMKDDCDCQRGYVGDDCDTNIYYSTILVPMLSLSGLILLICIGCLICGICFACCITFLGSCICLAWLGLTVAKQRVGISKFRKLKNFDLLLKEQQFDEDQSMAHIKINKGLFEIPYDEINIIEILGEGGSSSIVFKSEWREEVVAFKCFKTRLLMSSQSSFDEFEKEVAILSSLNHPHIIRFFGATLKPPRVGIIMEFCEQGDLMTFLLNYRAKNFGKAYPLNEKFRLVLDCCRAMSYCHSRKLVHRDLKCENVLVDRKESVKLMDFGLSKIVDKSIDPDKKMTRTVGTSIYMAPETIYSDSYDEKCDIYSFAIMFYVILTENEKPFGSSEYRVEFKVASDEDYRPSLDELNPILKNEKSLRWVKKILGKCWSGDPSERYSFSKIAGLFRNQLENIDPVEVVEEEDDQVNTRIKKKRENQSGEGRLRKEFEKLKVKCEKLEKELVEKDNRISYLEDVVKEKGDNV